VINVILPSGTQRYINGHVGETELKLCHRQADKCFKARVVEFADKFPGFSRFSSYLPVAFLQPDCIISQS